MNVFQKWFASHLRSDTPTRSQVNYTPVTEQKRTLIKQFINLLREFAVEVERLKPIVEWEDYKELTDRMTSIANQIEGELDEGRLSFNFNNFFFSHFNGKSPQGELWSYLSWRYDSLKKLDAHINQKWQDIITTESS